MKTPQSIKVMRPLLIALVSTTHLFGVEGTPTFASFIELPWSYVIGGHADGKWLNSETTGRQLTAPLTNYRVYTLNGEIAAATATAAAAGADLCPDVWQQKITTEIDTESRRRHAIGVNAPWNPMPRQSRASSLSQEVYVQAMKVVLTGQGIERPEVRLTQLLRVDLDGDGTDEVLTSATRYHVSDVPSAPRDGDYSVVTLRSVMGTQVQTQLVGGEVYAKADLNAAPNTYEIAGLLDLNGDGTLEVLIRSSYYEGGGMAVWQMQKGKLVQVLSIECGA